MDVSVSPGSNWIETGVVADAQITARNSHARRDMELEHVLEKMIKMQFRCLDLRMRRWRR
jgi:hypothetical protein